MINFAKSTSVIQLHVSFLCLLCLQTTKVDQFDDINCVPSYLNVLRMHSRLLHKIRSQNEPNANKPKLSIIRPETALTVFNGKTTVDVKSNSTIRLKCHGTQNIHWTFPSNYREFVPDESFAIIESDCGKTVCYSQVTINNLNFWDTGLYSCHYNNSDMKMIDSVYVFVNDANKLIVPYEGNDEFIIVPVLHNSSNIIIPCKPTNSKAIVTLQLYETDNSADIPINKVKFDPTIGFQVDKYEIHDYNELYCKVKLGRREQYVGVILHQTPHNRIELYPFISVWPNTTKVGDEVTLTCSVHIDRSTFVENNMFINISWHYDTNRAGKKQSLLSKATSETSSGAYETISLMLTIKSATISDSGLYKCDVTDLSGYSYSVTKNLVIKHFGSENQSPRSASIQLSDRNLAYMYFAIIFVLNF